MLLDFMPTHLASTPAGCSPALAVIAADPEPAGVLDLPRGYEAGNAAMMLAACHGHPIVAGETARQMGTTLLDRLETRDLAAQQRQLAAAKVKYVVLHQPNGEMFRWNKAGTAGWRLMPASISPWPTTRPADGAARLLIVRTPGGGL